MATAAAAAKNKVKEINFTWEGKDKSGKLVKGEMRAGGEAHVNAQLRRQGVLVSKIRKQKIGGGGKVSEKDISLFTRQLATMMKAGVPLLQAFDIVGKGHNNPAVARLLMAIKTEVETGSALATAFRKYPMYFDALFCNLVSAGEQAGILDALLDRLAIYKEKTLAIKSKIKAALFYPIAIIVVAFVVTAVIMIFVIPSFKQVFTAFGADLPAPTLIVMAISDFFVKFWYLIFGGIGGAFYGFMNLWKRSVPVQIAMDRLMLKLPVFGHLLMISTVARWTRTLSTMFAAGVPLVDALDSVGGAAGNYVYLLATKEIQREVSTGSSLTVAMQATGVFPSMVIQMVSIGEESGALDGMLGKVADFFEQEVDDAVEALASLMEPLIMVVLGGLIGSMVIAMYLPIFKMGQAV
ncbi:MAG: type II secretion system F family protein [Betaproteobacteria bacterium]|nr:type II secretion system F family protein [Betaproteobacteria bacterium]